MKTPIKKNVEPRLKVHLLQGKTITHNQAQRLWGTNRLAEYIRRLRKDGMKIQMLMVYENGDSFGVYSIPKTVKKNRITSGEYLKQAEYKR